MVTQNKPPAIAWQLDRCDVCGDKYHRKDLVRTQVEFLRMKAENFFLYSSYNSSYWTVDDASDVTSTTVATYGNRCDNVRLSLDDSNNLTYINSPKVWEGNGTVRISDISGDGYMTESSDVTVSFVFGPHEQNTSPSSTVAIGVCASDGSSKNVLKTYTDVSTVTRLWVNAEVATLAATGVGDNSGTNWRFYWYFQVTNAGKWWWDEAQREVNVNSLPTSADGQPENFTRTTGTRVSSSNHTEQSLMTQRKVCPNCSELILSKSERFGRTDESPIDEPVETWNQDI
jgi:hypothetical protein